MIYTALYYMTSSFCGACQCFRVSRRVCVGNLGNFPLNFVAFSDESESVRRVSSRASIATPKWNCFALCNKFRCLLDRGAPRPRPLGPQALREINHPRPNAAAVKGRPTRIFAPPFRICFAHFRSVPSFCHWQAGFVLVFMSLLIVQSRRNG